MPRVPFLNELRKLAAEHRLARRLCRPWDELHEQVAERRQAVRAGVTRRDFLIGAGALGAATLLPHSLISCNGDSGGSASGDLKVAIIGAGLAGLAAGVQLKDFGVDFTLFESQERVGGRMLTERAGARSCYLCHQADDKAANHKDVQWEDDQYADVFGELIDTQHLTMHKLAQRFNLPLIDMLGAEPAGSKDTYWFNQAFYPRSQALADFTPVWEKISKDLEDMEEEYGWDTINEAGKALDRMTITEWIETRVPGGNASALGKYLDAAYAIELGADCKDQSALNLILMLAYQDDPANFLIYGPSDEKYRIKGGADSLTTAMAQQIGEERIRLGQKLLSLKKTAAGLIELTFAGGQTVRAECVLLALPFPALRTLDYSGAGFDERKIRAIQQQGAAHNGKLQLQFKRRFWNDPGPWNPDGPGGQGPSNGTIYTDNGAQLCWDGTRGIPGTRGLFINYTGGSLCNNMSLAHPYGNQLDPTVNDDVQRFLSQLEEMFPGASAEWNGRAINSKAHLDLNYNSAYGFYKPGQYQDFSGYERVPQGNVFFAGEHTSMEFFGFMEGAAQEGERAAVEIMDQLGVKHT